LVVRNNSSFLVKRNGQQFSREAGNVMNLNTFKFNGLVNNKTVDVSLADSKDKKFKVVKVSTKTDVRRPATGTAVSRVTALRQNGGSRAESHVTNTTAGSFYRADLSKFAVARTAALTASLALKSAATPRKGNGKKTKRGAN